MSGSTLPQAFKLVRQLLSERPRAFQELLRDGISTFSGEELAPSIKGKGKSSGESVVPEGHPFVSARYVPVPLAVLSSCSSVTDDVCSYLKTRVLPILSSQGLILKSTKQGYSLPSPSATTPTTPSLENHWDRLISGESPSTLGFEHSSIRSELRQARKEARKEAEGETEDDRLMWYRSSKPMGKLATPLDRGFLNRRNGKKRWGKDMARMEKDQVLRDNTQPWPTEGEAQASV